MTNFAWLIGHNMARRHSRRDDTLAPSMATGTVTRRAFEYSADVTSTTLGNGMRTRQYETGRRMIEVAR